MNWRQQYRKIQPWLIWGLGAAFFFTEYFARVDPSVIVPELMRTFHVGAYAVGSLSAVFYYPYVIMQIPVGLLIDRYGSRRLLIVAAFVCSGGAYVFAIAGNIHIAMLGRFLIGLSAAFAFVGALKLATVWFEPRRLGLLAGLTQGMGMLGAAIGEGGFSFVVKAVGWRDTIALIATLLLALAILISIFVRDRRSNLLPVYTQSNIARESVFSSLMIIFRNRFCWANAIYSGLIYAPTAALAELWGATFFQNTYKLPATESALMVSAIFIGIAIGGPLAGFLSDRLGRRKPIMYLSAVMSFILLAVILFVPHLSVSLLFVLLFVYGLMNIGVALSYAVAGELVPQSVSGVSIAFTNMCSILVGGALFQPLIGWLLQKDWSGKIVHGVPIYSAHDYHNAVMVLPILFVLAFIAVFFIKETRCKGR